MTDILSETDRPSWPTAALFDLDGTLIDSAPDIAEAVAELLATEGLPPFSQDQVREMIGRGLRTLVARAFAGRGRPLDDAALSAMTARMMGIYPRHLVDKTVLMPGTIIALDWLEAKGCRLAIVTNKPQDFCEEILRHFGLFERFALVLGNQPLGGAGSLAPKPAPDMLLFALRKLGSLPAAAIMVGDSGADIEAANAGSIFSVGIRGGYTSAPLEDFRPRLMLDTLSSLPAALQAVGRTSPASGQ